MSTIKLYRNCKILEEKNFQVDDIEQYLASLTPVKTFDNAQYIKNGLDAEVKVTLDQTYLDKQWTNMYNYCSIEMDNGGQDNTYYYFIRKMQWISKDAIKLILHLDVLNTYQGAYKLTDKTIISRMHKDRFLNQKEQTISINNWLDDNTIWDWGTSAAGLTGNAEFQMDDLVGAQDIVCSFEVVPQRVNPIYWSYELEASSGTLIIKGDIQSETVTPEERVYITISVPRKPIKVDNELIRNIDFTSEGLNSILFKKGEKQLLNKYGNDTYSEDDGRKYYLIYQTQTNYSSSNPEDFIYNNPISCYLTADNAFSISAGGSVSIKMNTLNVQHTYALLFPTGADGRKLPNSFENDHPTDEITYNNLPRIKGKIIKTDDTEVPFEIGMETLPNTDRFRCSILKFYFAQAVNDWKCDCVQLKRDNFFGSYITPYNVKPIKEIILENVSKVVVAESQDEHPYGHNTINNYYDFFVNKADLPYPQFTGTTNTTTEVPAIDKTDNNSKPLYDLTSQKLVKIIELPYLPDGIQYYDENLDTIVYSGNDWRVESGTNKLVLSTLNKTAFESSTNFDCGTYHPANKLFIEYPAGTITTINRNDKFESKLYHSDFYQIKFVYDSFSYPFNLENYDVRTLVNKYNSSSSLLTGKFIKSTNASSAMMFDFDINESIKTSMQDYEKIFVVNRNLEYPIFNNYYLNYLRNGYNYDIKNKQTANVASGIGVGLGVAQVVAGIALSETGIGAGMIATGAITIASSLTGAITNSVKADQALQQKLEQAKNQGASVQGADDLGLLDYYTDGNKAKIAEYGLSESTYKAVADLFYYCGYKCDYQDVPDVYSRYWFNFIQCDPVYDCDNTTAKMSKDQKDELTNKYREGVTVLHHHSTWDFDQVKENWEMGLIPIL